MLPKVIIYNSVSLDGAIKGFELDLILHYEILGRFGADALLAGSNTAKTGIELFMKDVPAEESSDFLKPRTNPGDERMLWVIPDSKGVLKGLLHVHRKSGFAKDIIVLVSKQTSKDYIDYLKERNYDILVAGDNQVDYRLALEELKKRYGINAIVTDTGGVLTSVLLDNELVDEIQLLVAPQIVGEKSVNLFRSLHKTVKLRLIKTEVVGEDHMLLAYKVLNKYSPH